MPRFPFINFDKSSQKTLKIRYQMFVVLPSFPGFLLFVPNILSEIFVRSFLRLAFFNLPPKLCR